MIGLSGDGTSFLAGNNGRGKQTVRNWPRWTGHIVWSSWTMTQAVGAGVNWIDNCRPDCARGKYYGHPARLRAYRPRNGRFTRLRTRIRSNGRWRTQTRTLVYNRGSWYWG